MIQIIHFISGHLDLTMAEFVEHYRSRIDRAIALGEGFVVGDARGADSKAQDYLLGKTQQVHVYHMHGSPRYNAGFITKGGYVSDRDRDRHMTEDSHQDIAWVRPGREQSGTQQNLDRRKKNRRSV